MCYIETMKTNRSDIPPRDRILKTASELFFHQGVRATGINEVIEKSGVAKATFYHHFPTKDDLCLAYLRERNAAEFESVEGYVRHHETPRERFLSVIEAVLPWLEANQLRGCVFLNMVAEVPDPVNVLRSEGVQHYESLRRLVAQLAKDLVDSDPPSYGHVNAVELADDYLVILGGAIAMTEIYHDPWPARHAVSLIERLIDQRGAVSLEKTV
jgi:AcrR family transcriptional regulator